MKQTDNSIGAIIERNLIKFFVIVIVFCILLLYTLFSVKVIQSGSVGVRTTFGDINLVEVKSGITTNFLSSINRYNTREYPISLSLTPKAKDNLSLKDLDIIVYYQINEDMVADTVSKYRNLSIEDTNIDLFIPGYMLVRQQASSIIGKEISTVDSLDVHKNLNLVEQNVKSSLQEALDKDDNGVFKITKVTITKALTDSSVEDSIRKVVKSEKEFESMGFKYKTAQKRSRYQRSVK